MIEAITSKDNALLKRIRLFGRDGAAYRDQGVVWLEGDHLIRAAVARGHQPDVVVWTESALSQWPHWLQWPARHVQVDAAVMKGLSDLGSAPTVGALFACAQAAQIALGSPTVVLDRLQDPGNVGSILRTASAMGFSQVVALRGTVALWSPKVVRAGMGAHFHLNLVEQQDAAAVMHLGVPLLATSSHQGAFLHQANLPWPCAWLLGHEGQGAAPALMQAAEQTVRIIQPGGEESLNVAAAAAICLHGSAASRVAAGL
jgi:RNA methyltransferase, TrmH family